MNCDIFKVYRGMRRGEKSEGGGGLDFAVGAEFEFIEFARKYLSRFWDNNSKST